MSNFYASDTPERASSVDSVFSDIVPTDFVNAVSQLGADHLVEAMYQAVDSMKVSHHQNHPSSQNNNQQQQVSSPTNHQEQFIFQHQHQNQKQIVLNQQQMALLQQLMSQLTGGVSANNNNINQNTMMQLNNNNRNSNNNNNNNNDHHHHVVGNTHRSSSSLFVTNDSSPMDHANHDSRSTSITTTGTSATATPAPAALTRRISVSSKDEQQKEQEQNTNHHHHKKEEGGPVTVSLEKTIKDEVDDTQKGRARQANRRALGKFVETLDSAFDDDAEADEIALAKRNGHDERDDEDGNPLPPQRNEKFQPVVTRLKHSPSRRRAAKKSEDLRNTAVVEGDDPAIIAIPSKTPRGNNYPSTPSYWGTSCTSPIADGRSINSSSRQHHNSRSATATATASSNIRSPSGTHVGGGGAESSGWSAQKQRAGLQTPPVPRPDLQDEVDLADKALLARRRRSEQFAADGTTPITWSEIQQEEARKRDQQDIEQGWKTDLKRRVAAVSEHYRRQFAATTTSANDDENNELLLDEHRETEQQNSTRRLPLRQPTTPSETVFKSRAVRMSAAEHNIISASPQLHAALDGKPRVRSPYGPLLSVSELDHFVPSVHQTETSQKIHEPLRSVSASHRQGQEAIEKALREGSLEVADRAMHSVDRWTHRRQNSNNELGSAQATATRSEELKAAHDAELKKQEEDLAKFLVEKSNRREEREKENSVKRYDRNLSNANDIINSSKDRPSFYSSSPSSATTTTSKNRVVQLVPGASVVDVDLEPSRQNEEDILSSPQLNAMLGRIMKTKEELGGGGGTDNSRSHQSSNFHSSSSSQNLQPRSNSTVLLNDDGTVSDVISRRQLFEH